ncbi:MAG: ABC transporter permease [Rhodoferax sp.]|uniref:ABC transporter permease n=1 Tax=Rhodoferax sp. TaxID=50421 RepID=UPI0032660608
MTPTSSSVPTAQPRAEATRSSRHWVKALVDHGPELSLLVLCVALSLATDTFFSFRNLLNVLDQLTVLGIMALGMTAVIVIGGIDLSVGSVLALSMMGMGWLSNTMGVPMPLAMVAALGIGALCGLGSGLLITHARLPAFIATLATMSICRGLANMVTDGSQIVGYPEWFSAMSINRNFGFLSVTVALFIVLTIVAGVFMKYRAAGRALYAIGGSAEVARLAGIPVRKVTLAVYTVCGVLSGLAGVVMSTRLDSSQPSGGMGYELDTIAAVVIGGASLSGGVGSIWGTLMGVLTIGVLRNGLNLLGVSPFVQQVVIGGVIILAVAVDSNKRRIG